MQVRGTNGSPAGTGTGGSAPAGGRLRTVLLAAFWFGLVGLLWGTDLAVKLAEQAQSGGGKGTFRLVSEQVTSAFAVLIMIPFVVRWLTVFPLQARRWASAVIGHTAGSVFFAFGHYALMVVMRLAWYSLNGHDYIWRENFVSNLIVEYQKDIKIYLGIIVIVTAWRLYQGGSATAADPSPTRLLVQTGSGEALVNYAEIECFEAARNYIAVHTADGEFLLRKTMKELAANLDNGTFARTHRSFIVNLEHVREIRAEDSAHVVILKSGRSVPLSRNRRDTFLAVVRGALTLP